MAIIKDGVLVNTEEDNKAVEEYLHKQPRILVRVEETGEKSLMPCVSMPDHADYIWQKNCLKDRTEHPEKYKALNEDVSATIEHLKNWLRDYEEEHPEVLLENL